VPTDVPKFIGMTLGELFSNLGRYLDWFRVALWVVPQFVALARARALLRKGRTWFAWVGGLTSILALWVAFVCWLIFSCFSEGCEDVGLFNYTLGIIFSVLALLTEFLVFSAVFLGMRILHRSGAITIPHREEDVLIGSVPRRRAVPLLLLLSSLIGALLAHGIARLIASGEFVSWRSLGSPPGHSRTILRADTWVIEVETRDGTSYFADINSRPCRGDPPEISCWAEGPKYVRSLDSTLTDDSHGCGRKFRTGITPANGVGEVQRFHCTGAFSVQTSYVLFPDGEIAVWSHRTDEADLFEKGIRALIAGGVLGFLAASVGIAIAIRRMPRLVDSAPSPVASE